MVKYSYEWKDDSGKIVATGMINQMLRLMLSKLDQWEALSVNKTEHPSVTDQNSDIFVLTIGAATNMNEEGVVCTINLL